MYLLKTVKTVKTFLDAVFLCENLFSELFSEIIFRIKKNFFGTVEHF